MEAVELALRPPVEQPHVQPLELARKSERRLLLFALLRRLGLLVLGRRRLLLLLGLAVRVHELIER